MDDKLKAAVTADSVERVAKLMAQRCERFATKCIGVTTGEEVLRMVADLAPELTILSLDLRSPGTLDVITELRRQRRQTHLVVAFRDLTIADMQGLAKLGIDDLLPLPIDPVSLARLVWLRFKINARVHQRFDFSLDVRGAEGTLLGRTRNLSAGGMLLADVTQPLVRGVMLLSDLMLPNDQPLRVRASVLAAEGQIPSPMWARVQFEPLRGAERQRLTSFLNHLADQQLPPQPLITLPVSQETRRTAERAVVFVVDDEPDALDMFTRTLRGAYEVVTFADPREALKAAIAAPPALVITDHRMPNMTGVQLVRELGEAAVECPTIMLTAYPEATEVVEARELLFSVVPKPARPEDLLAYARIAISSHRLKTVTTRMEKVAGRKLPRTGGGNP